jgi:hypothetical protein
MRKVLMALLTIVVAGGYGTVRYMNREDAA